MKMVGNRKKANAMMDALKSVGSPQVHMLPKEKEPKGRGVISESSYYNRPSIWLTNKDFPGVENFKVGQKVVLAVECTVERMSTREESEGKDRQTETTLEISAISDITGGKK